MKLVVSLLVVLLAFLSPAVAQMNRGTITGTVTDASGAAVPGAQVSIRNTATNATYKTDTTGVGQFTLPNLPVGVYEVVVEAAGFKKSVRTDIDLRATDVVRVDVTLEIGALAETVEVSGQITRIQTDTPQVGTSLTNSSIVDLPLSFSGARSPESFAYRLTPGVTGDSWTSHVNGSTTASKDVLLDGASVSTYRGGHFGESSVSLEAVQEFKVQTSGMSAEFGRFQAGVFNFIMKSGANDVHGSAYGALRNEALNANTFVNKFRGVKRSQDRRQNGAVSFGSPVYLPKIYNGRDKTFFYVTYERYRDRTSGMAAPNRTLPLPDFYEGNFSRLLGAAIAQTDALGRPVLKGAIYDPVSFRQVSGGRWVGDMFPGNSIPKSRFSQVSQKLNAIAQKSYLPTIRDATGQIALVNNGVFPVSNTPQFDQHQLSIKGDQVITAQQRLSGSYTYVARPRLLLDAGGMWDPSDPEGGPLSKARRQRIKSQLARLAYDWVASPHLLVNINGSWNWMGNPNRSVHMGLDGAKELGIKNLTTYGYPTINWGGGPFVSLDTPGDTQNDLSVYASSGLQGTGSLTKGKHFIRFGYDHRRNQLNSRPTQGGSFTFAARGTAIPNETFSGSQIGYSFASYLLGIVDSAGLGTPIGLGGRRRYYGLFVQDDFKVSRTLTLNLGLRWEFQPPYFEVGNRMASWNLTKPDPATGRLGAYDFAGSCQICTGQRYFGHRDYKGFSPRLGLAWQPISNWTVRAAYGIFFEGDLFNNYGAIPGASAFPFQGSYNLSADPVDPWRGIFNWDTGFPTDRFIAPAFDVSYAYRSGSASMIDPRYGGGAYTQQWNLNIQRQLAKTLVLDIGYVGNKTTAIRNNALARLNQLPASVLTTYGRNLTTPVRTPEEAAAGGVKYPFPGYRGTVAGALRDYPQLSGLNTIGPYAAPLGFANFHSLQVTVDKQSSKGLSLYANYVYSKVLANTESSFMGDNSGPLDYYNLKLEKAPASFDRPHMFKAYMRYEVPFGKGRAFSSSFRLLNDVLGGWAISGIFNYFSGGPLGFGGASSPMPNGWNGGQRPNIAAGNMKASGYGKASFNFANTAAPEDTYINKSLFSDPPALTLGDSAVRYGQIRGFGTISEDFGLLKNFRFHERCRVQVRGEFLNLLNRHQLGGINTTITSPLFGQVTSVSGNRSIQLGLRMDF
jgi:hypothetical protein